MQSYTCIHNNAFLQATIGFCMLALVCNVWGYPTGAPAPACAKLGPIHMNATAQTSPSPYKIVVTSDIEGDLKWAAGSSLKGRLFHAQVITFTVSNYIIQKHELHSSWPFERMASTSQRGGNHKFTANSGCKLCINL